MGGCGLRMIDWMSWSDCLDRSDCVDVGMIKGTSRLLIYLSYSLREHFISWAKI